MSSFESIFADLPREPFTWQIEQTRKFHDKIQAGDGSGTFALVAAPNSGKTDAAALNIHVAMSSFKITSSIFVSPSSVIRDQIVDDFAFLGLTFSAAQPNRKLIKSRLDPALDGISVTYAQVTRFPDLFRKLSSQQPTMVVLDEVHHLASDLSWGDACKHAFEHSQIRLVMSGTPFRCDGNAIPFVRYEEDA